MDTSRLPYVDSLKGFAMIVIVIVHHCISFIPDWLTSWMTSFFVDAFYIAVGWVYAVKAREFNVASTARKRLRQLGIPYLWFSLILFCITCLWVAVGHFETSAIPIAGFKVACLRGIGTLWFLPALFFSEIIFVYVMSRSFRKNVKLKRGLLVVLLAVLSTIFEIVYQALPISYGTGTLHKILGAITYPYYRGIIGWLMVMAGYVAGRLLKSKFESCITPMRKFRLALSGILIITLDMLFFRYGNPQYDTLSKVVIAIIPSAGIMMLSHGLYPILRMGFLAYWGRNSIIMMVTHYTFTIELFRYINRMITGNPIMGDVANALSVILCIAITYPMVWLITHKYPQLIGRLSRDTCRVA